MKDVLKRIDPADLIVEVISVMLAILLAFAVNHWQEQQRIAQDVTIEIANIRDEIAANDRLLESQREHHRRVWLAFQRLTAKPRVLTLDDFYGTFYRFSPHGFKPFVGESFAWDIARSSPSVVAIPYDSRVQLERTYAEQALLNSLSGTLGGDMHISSTNRNPDLYVAAMALSLDLGDIVAVEDRLHALYKTDLRSKHPI